MSTLRPHAAGWLWALLGLAWVAVAGWIWLTRGSVLLAGHPAYPVTAALGGLVGVVLLLVGVRAAGVGRSRAGKATGRRSPRRRAWGRWLGRAAMVLLTLVGVLGLAWLRPFAATPGASALMAGSDTVAVSDATGRITLTPTGAAPTSGLIFQPGARVDPRAYLPMLEEVAAQGHLVVIVKQPFDIGFTALGAPAAVVADHPEVTSWSVGGHSLGGVVASRYAAEHVGQVGGLLLWASYPIDDLSGSELAVSTVFGSEDGLATPADIEASLADLPPDAQVVEVTGGVHAFFGDYGEQPGDGIPGIAREEAQQQIVTASVELLERASTGGR